MTYEKAKEQQAAFIAELRIAAILNATVEVEAAALFTIMEHLEFFEKLRDQLALIVSNPTEGRLSITELVKRVGLQADELAQWKQVATERQGTIETVRAALIAEGCADFTDDTAEMAGALCSHLREETAQVKAQVEGLIAHIATLNQELDSERAIGSRQARLVKMDTETLQKCTCVPHAGRHASTCPATGGDK